MWIVHESYGCVVFFKAKLSDLYGLRAISFWWGGEYPWWKKKWLCWLEQTYFLKIFFIADTLILDWRTQTRGVRETWKIWKPWINHICACAWKLPIGWPSYNIALISRINFNFYVLEVFINYRKAWHQVCQSCAIIAS